MKYQCNGCGRVFDMDDAINRTTTGANGKTPCYYDVCPFCESEDLNEDYKEQSHESVISDREDARDELEDR